MRNGVLPGMSWKNEQPLKEMLREEMGEEPVFRQNAPQEDRRGTGRAPLGSPFSPPRPEQTSLFGGPRLEQTSPAHEATALPPPRWNLFGTVTSAEPNHDQPLGAQNASLQMSTAPVDPAGSPNGNANHQTRDSPSHDLERGNDPRLAPAQTQR